MFHADFLQGVRRRALRRGVWFRALDRVERGIMELSCRGFDEVRTMILSIHHVIISKWKTSLSNIGK